MKSNEKPRKTFISMTSRLDFSPLLTSTGLALQLFAFSRFAAATASELSELRLEKLAIFLATAQMPELRVTLAALGATRQQREVSTCMYRHII